MIQSGFNFAILAVRFLFILSTGCTFAQSNVLDRRELFSDSKSGLVWFKGIIGHFSNGCVDSEGRSDSTKCSFETGATGDLKVKSTESNASMACSRVGGRLPKKNEFELLIRNFDHTINPIYGPTLSTQGLAELRKLLGSRIGEKFVTSTIDTSVRAPEPYEASQNYQLAYLFDSEFGYVYSGLRSNDYSVLCVIER